MEDADGIFSPGGYTPSAICPRRIAANCAYAGSRRSFLMRLDIINKAQFLILDWAFPSFGGSFQDPPGLLLYGGRPKAPSLVGQASRLSTHDGQSRVSRDRTTQDPHAPPST